MATCSPEELCLFLAWKDNVGKTPVHIISCPEMGKKAPVCQCPRRLAHGTLQGKISQLRDIFASLGREGQWHPQLGAGNPAMSDPVSIYLRQIQVEQSKGHVIIKQAKPMFIKKLTLISMYIDRQLSQPAITIRSKFILARDQAIFKLMLFGGDRAGDAGSMLIQEMKELPQEAGIMIRHTCGKTARVDKPNIFSLFRCQDKMICPVAGIERYVKIAKSLNVALTTGYLFRPVASDNLVLDQPLSHSAIYDRLKFYLSTLQIFEGETPHSLRGGSSITLRSLTQQNQATQDDQAIMDHIGWRSKQSADHYTRSASTDQATRLSAAMSNMSQGAPQPQFVEATALPHRFTQT
jgi:hypothetical protein